MGIILIVKEEQFTGWAGRGACGKCQLFLRRIQQGRNLYRASGIRGLPNHSSILVGIIPWTEEPGGLESMGSQKQQKHWTRPNTHACSRMLLHLKLFYFL